MPWVIQADLGVILCPRPGLSSSLHGITARKRANACSDASPALRVVRIVFAG